MTPTCKSPRGISAFTAIVCTCVSVQHCMGSEGKHNPSKLCYNVITLMMCKYTHTASYVPASLTTCLHKCTYMYIRTHRCTCTCTCMFIHVYTYMYAFRCIVRIRLQYVCVHVNRNYTHIMCTHITYQVKSSS